MTDENEVLQPQKSVAALVIGAVGAVVIGGLIVFLMMYFGMVAEANQRAGNAIQASAEKSARIAELEKEREGMLEEKALYELNNAQNLALIAKLRGFCGKPCEGVE